MPKTSIEIPLDVRERIYRAADELYQQSGRKTFPIVDQVRRLAAVDMNAASAVMRDWRKEQTLQAAPVAIQVPEGVTTAADKAIETLWIQAQNLANEALRVAQAAWEKERAEAEVLRDELSAAFDQQAVELQAAHRRIEEAEQAAQIANKMAAAEMGALRAQMAEIATRAERSDAVAGEVEYRVSDYRVELDRTHAEAERLREELNTLRIEQAAIQKQAAAEIQAANVATETVRAEFIKLQTKFDTQAQTLVAERKQAAEETHRLAERLAKTEANLEIARKESGEARERAAGLAGKLELVMQQNTELMTSIKASAKKG